jgi:hypothetical protein
LLISIEFLLVRGISFRWKLGSSYSLRSIGDLSVCH